MDNISLDVEKGETLVLLGRSGSGKTTALRLINRLLEPSAGKISIAGQAIKDLDPTVLRKRIGYVIQEFGLLPHWTLEQNVGLVPSLLGWDKSRIHQRTNELLDQVGLTGLNGRYPSELSGGQRQRIAVARALAASPDLLLFDEPFGALDPVTRYEMQQLFLSIRSRFGGASVFVTHDVLEALKLGSRIAVLEQGRLEGVFTPAEFQSAQTPIAKAFLATLPQFLGRASV